MEDFEICHITSVYAVNCFELLISSISAISEDMMDTGRKEEREQRTECARNQKKTKQNKTITKDCHLIITSPNPNTLKNYWYCGYLLSLFHSALYNSQHTGGAPVALQQWEKRITQDLQHLADTSNQRQLSFDTISSPSWSFS